MTWKVYQNLPDNFTDNPLAGFKQFRRANELAGNNPNAPWSPSVDAANPLYKGVANTMPDGGFLKALRDDALNGTLPQVSWIVAPANYSEHPGPSSPVQGRLVHPGDAGRADRESGRLEQDGAVDQLRRERRLFRPCAAARRALARYRRRHAARRRRQRRWPARRRSIPIWIVTRPSQQDPADHRVYGGPARADVCGLALEPRRLGQLAVLDHTSVLRFLEARFKIKEENISPWRRAVLGDLTSAFNFVTPNNETLPDLKLLTRAGADQLRTDQQALPQVTVPDPSVQAKPQQRTGVRYSRACPTSSTLAAAQAVLPPLVFANTADFPKMSVPASVFHVYDKLHLDRIPRRYTVEPGKQLEGRWDAAADGGKYDLWVMGHNGFLRHFAGDLALARTAQLDAEIRVCYDIANGDVCQFMNNGVAPCTFVVTPNAYYVNHERWTLTVPAGGQVEQAWPLANSNAWYDFSVTLNEDPAYLRRFAGRVETGRHGSSDPAMGT